MLTRLFGFPKPHIEYKSADPNIDFIGIGITFVLHKQADTRLRPFIKRWNKMDMRLLWILILGWLREDSDIVLHMAPQYVWRSQMIAYICEQPELNFLFEAEGDCVRFKDEISTEYRQNIIQFVKDNYKITAVV